MSQTNTAHRLYALDALRGVMMLLGVVLHVALPYAVQLDPLFWPTDPDRSLVFSILAMFIHLFRMPLFFVVAGFFAAMLVAKKGANGMLRNRFRRITLPLVAGVLLLYPLVVFVFTFSFTAFAGVPGPLLASWNDFTGSRFMANIQTMHLWFLYFLSFFALVGWILARLIPEASRLAQAAGRIFTILFGTLAGRLLTTVALFWVCLWWMKSPDIRTETGWLPNPAVVTCYSLFFGIGWMIFRTGTLVRFSARPLWLLAAGLLLFGASLLLPQEPKGWTFTLKQFSTAICGTLFLYGFLALFLRYCNHYSPRLSYLMDAAYWVYIIHLPIAVFVPGLMAGWALPVFLKFFLSLAITFSMSMLSYKYLVRGTFVGMFLNGRVHRKERKPSLSMA